MRWCGIARPLVAFAIGSRQYQDMKKAVTQKLVETLPIDPRRRLAIVRCDDREHLLILGTNSETVIESDIKPPQDEAQILKIEKSA